MTLDADVTSLIVDTDGPSDTRLTLGRTFREHVSLFNGLASDPPAIPSSVTCVETLGYLLEGSGRATYRFSSSIDGAYVSANPRTSFLAADGRGFGLVADKGISPFTFGAAGDGSTDDSDAVETFLGYISENNVGLADASGHFAVSRALFFGDGVASPSTKSVQGEMQLSATPGSSGQAILTIRKWDGGYWESLRVTGTGSVSTFSTRTWQTGLALDGAGRIKFERIHCALFSYAGIARIGGNVTGCHFGEVRAYDCGPGARGASANFGISAAWSVRVDSGSSGSLAQRTTISVDTLPPEFVSDGVWGAVGDAPYLVRINDSGGEPRLYFIYGIDRGSSTLTIFPWIDPSLTSGTLDYVYGGGLFIHGSDNNVIGFDMIDAMRCGVALSCGSPYGPVGRRLISQVCGIAVSVGRHPAGAALGTHVDGLYCENNIHDIVSVSMSTSDGVYAWFGSEYALNLAKCATVAAPRLSSGEFSSRFMGLRGFTIAYRGSFLVGEKAPHNSVSSTHLVEIARPDQRLVLKKDSHELNLSLDKDVHRLMGYDSLELIYLGSGPSQEPTGTITINAPSGYELDDGSVTRHYSSMSGVLRVLVWVDVKEQIVTLIKLSG
ncbi:hypothetical protein [Phytoactinopolyspora limicola]|uniref:hypothetical protein n=1 Tax=Phytoactinopolyspora limicola TaxID=2715536 RepID=UPI001408D715|nr:hypothetical protein [Phytoactinopolyspora limicola]